MEELRAALGRAATDLPRVQVERLADSLTGFIAPSPTARHEVLKVVPTAVFRHHVAAIFSAWEDDPSSTGNDIALALRVAADVAASLRDVEEITVVATGPASYEVPVRATSATLIDVIASAKQDLLLVSFAAYKVPDVTEALEAALGRGVSITFVLESAAESKGALSFDASAAFSDLGSEVTFYVWPSDKRLCPNGHHVSMHSKCVVADRRIAFITSANLTGAAMEGNMELGVVVRGGDVPRRIAGHFRALIEGGILVRES